jgi:glycosyltransferase involved in cell wall biosynthesis
MYNDDRVGVLYLQSNSEIGGSDVALLRLVESLDRTRFRPVIVLPADGPLTKDFEKRGAKVVVVSEMLKLTTQKGSIHYLRFLVNYPLAVWRILRLIRREQIDLIHTNTLHNLYGYPAAKLAGLPHVWHVREIVRQSAFFSRIESFLARYFADRIIAVSSAAAQLFRGKTGEYPPRLRIMWDGINLNQFHPGNSGHRIRSELGLPREAPLVGLVCRLDHWKGVEVFLQAISMCRKECPDARYVICGGEVEGREKVARRARRLAEELDLTDVVHFTEWHYRPEDMPEVHATLDVLVLSSTWPEPFGLVLIEAMASGKPVVATDQGGPVEICVEGSTALLIPPQNPRRMADAIITLLCDPQRAAAMGRAGRRRAEEYFDERRYARELQLLYEDVLDRRGPGAPQT